MQSSVNGLFVDAVMARTAVTAVPTLCWVPVQARHFLPFTVSAHYYGFWDSDLRPSLYAKERLQFLHPRWQFVPDDLLDNPAIFHYAEPIRHLGRKSEILLHQKYCVAFFF